MSTDALRAFIEARLGEDEQWARAASQPYKYASEEARPPEGGVHWTWVVGENWTPVTVDPVADDTVGGEEYYGYTVNLASVEEWPTRTAGRSQTMPRTVANSMVEVDSAAAGHIARHDPARVLREVAAKRAILKAHEPFEVQGDPYPGCSVCSWRDHMYEQLHDGYPCLTLRALASIFADHPDYDPSWSTT